MTSYNVLGINFFILDYAQSLKVLADLKLLHRVMRGGEQAQSVEVSTPQSAVPTRQAVDAATLEPEMDGMNKSYICQCFAVCTKTPFLDSLPVLILKIQFA